MRLSESLHGYYHHPSVITLCQTEFRGYSQLLVRMLHALVMESTSPADEYICIDISCSNLSTDIQKSHRSSPWLRLATLTSNMILRLVAGVLCYFVVSYFVELIRWRARSHGRPLPPGPKSLPIVGNILHMSQQEMWKAHRRLCETYGECLCD